MPIVHSLDECKDMSDPSWRVAFVFHITKNLHNALGCVLVTTGNMLIPVLKVILV